VEDTLFRYDRTKPLWQHRFSLPSKDDVLIVVLGCAGYYVGALVGFALTFPSNSVSALWPPNAILLASLVLVPVASWWLVFLGTFAAHVAVQSQSGVPVEMILLWFVSNSSEALIGALSLRFFLKDGLDFASLKNVIVYAAFAVFLAPFLTSFLDAAFVTLVGWKDNSYWQVWLTRFPSNVVAAIAIPPFLVLWFTQGVVWLRRSSRRQRAELLLVLIGLVVVSFVVFHHPSPRLRNIAPLLYLPLPFLLWAAMRFGSLGASTSLLVLVLISIWCVAQGGGPFAQGPLAHNVNTLQVVLISISLPIMLLAGLFEEREEKSRALRESEARFRSMADTVPVLMWMSGPDKLCTFVNQGWLAFTGRTIELELGDGWSGGIHPEDRERILETYTKAFDARLRLMMDYRLRRFDGEYRWVLDTGAPRFDSQGAFLGYIGSVIDITDRKRAESELRIQREELAHVTRLSTMGELAASLAHELNQPLTAILSNAQAAQRFLAKDPTNLKEMNEILQDIVNDNSRAGEVIKRMRTLVKKEAPDFSPLDIGSVISDVVLLAHSDAILHNVRLLLEVSPDLPPVRGDRVQLQQVVLNLILNAFDAMADCPASQREIKVRAGRSIGRMLMVAVSDKGTGISEEHRETIFHPFYTTKHSGLGMGLSISRTIIEAHGGRLSAENNPDRGATFYFSIPVVGA
jgi:two-component system, LuxR family, sensor kinase FixL